MNKHPMLASRHLRPLRQPTQGSRKQGGIVLILALIMLVIISMLTAMSVRNATSSEGVSANVRQTQLAAQAAESALRYCENALISLVSATGVGGTVTTAASASAVTLAVSHIYDMAASTPTSMVAANWDGATSLTRTQLLIVPTSSVNRAGITSTFSRPPECMIDRLSPAASSTYAKNFNITARGFGPEVGAADANRTRPVGSEVWMQSSLELQ